MFKEIMVPLDGSELAEHALPTALRLGAAPGVTLHLVRVVDLLPFKAWAPTQIYLTEEMVDSAQVEARTYLEGVRDRLVTEGVTVHCALLSGYAASALLDYEEEANIDLVVMCSHGRTGLARYAVGSVADRLVRHGRAPIVLVRAFGEPVHLQHAVAGLDGSQRAEAALELINQLAPQLIHDVTLLRAVERREEVALAEEYLRLVAARMRRQGLAIHIHVALDEPATAILESAGTDKLVVATTHGRSAIGRWTLGTVADRLTHGRAPAVLLLREPDLE